MINKEIPALVIDETDSLFVITSLENHPLIIPKNHVADLTDLDDNVAADVMIEAVKIARALKKATDCEGINLVQSNGTAAGQDVFHFHLHVKPRWSKDDVTLSWNTDEVDFDQRQEFTDLLRGAV